MNIKSLIGQKIAVHCPTEAEANKFLTMCHDGGIRWSGEGREVTIPHHDWEPDTAYRINDGSLNFGSLDWYIDRMGYGIITVSEITYPPESHDFIDRAAIAIAAAEHAKNTWIKEPDYAFAAMVAYKQAVALHEERNRIFNEVKIK